MSTSAPKACSSCYGTGWDVAGHLCGCGCRPVITAAPEIEPQPQQGALDLKQWRDVLALLNVVRSNAGMKLERHHTDEATRLLQILEPIHAAAKESPVVDIDLLALKALTKNFNIFVGACMSADGSPVAPSKRDLAQARACLPSSASHSFNPGNAAPAVDAVEQVMQAIKDAPAKIAVRMNTGPQGNMAGDVEVHSEYASGRLAGRLEALEEAAQIADSEYAEHMPQAGLNNGRNSDFAFGSVNSSERIAAAIRSMKTSKGGSE